MRFLAKWTALGGLVLLLVPRTAFSEVVCYDASLGALPDTQGWTFDRPGATPAPAIISGLLHVDNTSNNIFDNSNEQYWFRLDPSVDFGQHFTLEARLRVNSSNYTDGRFGYYFIVKDGDSSGNMALIGLTDTGFTADANEQAVVPYPIAGEFHTYRLAVINNEISFFIDDEEVATGIVPFLNTNPVTYHVVFGAAAGMSSSNTDLAYLCYSTVPPSIVVSVDIKPGTLLNPINTFSEGKIPVAILSTPTFDATARINRSSLTFGKTGDEPSLASCGNGDVNRDAIPDLVCHFNTPVTGFHPGDTLGTLRGIDIDGTAIQGTDSVKIIR